MKEVTRYVRAPERKILRARSGDRCEVCATDVTPDRHHIVAFAEGGDNTAENLLVLCPTCHRQIPPLLTEEQQRSLQAWHARAVVPRHATHPFDSAVSEFYFGPALFRDTQSFITMNGQKVIYLFKQGRRFYVNAVMIEHFSPTLLLLSNRLIVADPDAEIHAGRRSMTVDVAGKRVLDLSSRRGVPRLLLRFEYRGVLSEVTDDEMNMFGGRFRTSGGTPTFTRSTIQWND